MSEMLKPQLLMRLDTLSALPPVALPAGYTLRPYREGDASAWEMVIDDSFGGTHRFQQEMAASEFFLPERVKFICFEDAPIATASAWTNGEGMGYLHMVGVHRKHLGHGLGAQVSLAALHHMVKEGRSVAILNTDDFRIPAIKTYLKLGFVPEVSHENHIQRWSNVLNEIGRADLLALLPKTYVPKQK